ncbi:MerR family transcriptional regulator [Micromonospora zamorensis]|uniref:MerR family transcriptional regulator n=1 Tax=Micromonospora zamorensis TaxID=709883 RepID=UPI0033A20EB1
MPRTVAEAARLVGLSTHALRYYEQERLLRPARNAQVPRVLRPHPTCAASSSSPGCACPA